MFHTQHETFSAEAINKRGAINKKNVPKDGELIEKVLVLSINVLYPPILGRTAFSKTCIFFFTKGYK